MSRYHQIFLIHRLFSFYLLNIVNYILNNFILYNFDRLPKGSSDIYNTSGFVCKINENSPKKNEGLNR